MITIHILLSLLDIAMAVAVALFVAFLAVGLLVWALTLLAKLNNAIDAIGVAAVTTIRNLLSKDR